MVGSAIGCSLEKSGSHTSLARPDNAGFLAFVAVYPTAAAAARGRPGRDRAGVGGAGGFDCVVADWRVTNLLSSRAW